MKKTLVRIICLTLIFIIGILPLAAAANQGYFYIKTGNGKGVNVRTDPFKASGNVVTTIPYRSYVLVYQYNSNKTWAYIEAQNPHGKGTVKGWVQKSFLSRKDPGKYTPVKPDPTQEVTLADINKACKAIKTLKTPYTTVIQTQKATNFVHLRMFPDTNAVFTAQYLCDTEIEVLAESKTWAQVRILEDGKVGFILKSCVAPIQ